MRKFLMATSFSVAVAFCAQAQESETVEELASDAEVASVTETISKIGCEAVEVEKESPTLFELDDATCEIGQYDIKLDGDFNIISMTRDE